MNQSNLIKKLVNRITNLNKKIVSDIVSSILEYISIYLIYGKTVKITNFGSFILCSRSSRLGKIIYHDSIFVFKKSYFPIFKSGKLLN